MKNSYLGAGVALVLGLAGMGVSKYRCGSVVPVRPQEPLPELSYLALVEKYEAEQNINQLHNVHNILTANAWLPANIDNVPSQLEEVVEAALEEITLVEKAITTHKPSAEQAINGAIDKYKVWLAEYKQSKAYQVQSTRFREESNKYKEDFIDYIDARIALGTGLVGVFAGVLLSFIPNEKR